MIIRKTFKIPAKAHIERDGNGIIVSKTETPDIDWELDPALSNLNKDVIWENDVKYFKTEIEFDEKDLQHFLDKGWEEI